jgi:molybdate transport system ATP-binding protein
MSFLEIENLHVNLGEFYLKGVSLSLDRGNYLAIMGPTGAGKTIFLESVIGFYRPDRGIIRLKGRDITNELPEKRGIGIVYQDCALLPHLTVYDNIAYGLKKKTRNGIREKVGEMAGGLHIDHILHRKPANLSGGEQQRVALARALVVEPRLLLMDEPFSALDPGTRRKTRKLLRRIIQKQNTTVIHITHDLDDAWALADTAAFFRDGRLSQFGTLGEVFNRPTSQFIADFVGVTILHGKAVERKNGQTCLAVNGFQMFSLDDAEPGADVRVAVRPENISISRNRPDKISTQNIIPGILEYIDQDGNFCSLGIRAEKTLFTVLVTNNALEQLEVDRDDQVFALIKSANVRIV